MVPTVTVRVVCSKRSRVYLSGSTHGGVVGLMESFPCQNRARFVVRGTDHYNRPFDSGPVCGTHRNSAIREATGGLDCYDHDKLGIFDLYGNPVDKEIPA